MNNRAADVMEAGDRLIASSSGVWAGTQLLKALKEGRPLNSAALRTNDTLRKDEWIHFDQAVVSETTLRLGAVADLIEAGLVMKVTNALGKTQIQYQRTGDMEPADVSMGGVARTPNDRVDYALAGIPNPIVHKDFNLNLRTLEASRNSGDPLDTTNSRIAARVVAEKIESMLFNGGPTFAGLPLYGLRTHPDRNTGSFGTNGAWNLSAKTGPNIVADIITMITALEADGYYGPYFLYASSNASPRFADDYVANYPKTIMQRIEDIPQIKKFRVVDQLPSGNVILVQASSDVVQIAEGEQPQTVQWDLAGGFELAFKVWAIMTPVVKSARSTKSGIFHMS